MNEVSEIAESSLFLEDEFDVLNNEQKQFILITFKEYVGYYITEDIIPLAVEELLSKIIYEDDKQVIVYEGTPDLIYCTEKDDTPYPMDHKTESARRNFYGLNNQFLGYPFLTGAKKIYRNAIGLQKTKKPADKFYRDPIAFADGVFKTWSNNVVEIGKKIIGSYSEDKWEGHYSMCEGNNIHRSGCIFQQVCDKSEVNWAYELETEFVKVKGLYYR
jgi:hypothetical protein